MDGYAATMEIVTATDAEALASLAADLVRREVESGPLVALGLAGGTTPRATYLALASLDVDWTRTAAWMTDERWVPPMHPDSNQRMVRETLVSPTGVRFLRPDTTLRSPRASAERFTDVLTSVLSTVERRVTLLGIGADGHTASLFPGTAALESDGPRYVANFVPHLDAWRLTATLDLLSTSDVVVFVVSGAAKAPVVAEIAAGADLPAGRVTASERVVWLLDEDAASRLP